MKTILTILTTVIICCILFFAYEDANPRADKYLIDDALILSKYYPDLIIRFKDIEQNCRIIENEHEVIKEDIDKLLLYKKNSMNSTTDLYKRIIEMDHKLTKYSSENKLNCQQCHKCKRPCPYPSTKDLKTKL